MGFDETAAGRDAEALAQALDRLANRVGRFLARPRIDADDIELWIRHTEARGWRIAGRELKPRGSDPDIQVGVRVFKDGRMGHAGCHALEESAWQIAARRALAAVEPSHEPMPGRPATRRPSPMTFDPDLADELADGRALRRIAAAVCDNAWHEASRIPGLASLGGHLTYDVRQYVVGNRAGVLGSLHGALDARVELNGVYGDVFHQTHAPESFLPLALLGARTWRTMPRAHATPADLGLKGPAPVVLHPRLLEALLRRLGPRIFTARALRDGRVGFEEGDRIAAPSVTLVDDPGLDGLSSSRGFDDEGVPTRRTPLLVRGRLTQLLRGRSEALRVGGVPSGSAWRLGDRARSPAETPARVAFGSLLMERGELGFHDMVAEVGRSIMVHEVEDLDDVDPETGRFSCRVRWGVTLEPGAEGRLLARGAWRIGGYLFAAPDGTPGLLAGDVALSRELYDTGSAILPYCLGTLEV